MPPNCGKAHFKYLLVLRAVLVVGITDSVIFCTSHFEIFLSPIIKVLLNDWDFQYNTSNIQEDHNFYSKESLGISSP